MIRRLLHQGRRREDDLADGESIDLALWYEDVVESDVRIPRRKGVPGALWMQMTPRVRVALVEHQLDGVARDVAAAEPDHRANPSWHPADLEQLWRRIVFSICVSNTDDHLRNHGFMLGPSGWSLAPAYDMNPVPYAKGLNLNISEHSNALDLDLVIDVAPYFRIKTKDEAKRKRFRLCPLVKLSHSF